MKFANHYNPVDSTVFLDTHLDDSDFFIVSNTKIDFLIGNEYVYNN